MSEEQKQQALTPEQQKQRSIQWQRQCIQTAQKHLADKGILPETIIEKECRYIEPIVALWKIKGQNGKRYWVITGNLPTDHLESSVAETPRDALRYFSFHWQMKAEEILSVKPVDKTQADFANLLINRAHGLYDLYSKDELWASEAS
ncbi:MULTISPECIES: DUF4826 family protein [unclassified Pseudoalteromonas]|uniref:DUF4826 family protein n=1 Tax=unclassified Pseudoalteromonas TaxID=194690 RepID=UPI0030142DC1